MLKTMFDLPGQNDIEEVIIDTGAINGDSEPIVVHSKNKSKVFLLKMILGLQSLCVLQE